MDLRHSVLVVGLFRRHPLGITSASSRAGPHQGARERLALSALQAFQLPPVFYSGRDD